MISASDCPSDVVQLSPDMRPIFERFEIGTMESTKSIEAHACTLGFDVNFLVQLANASIEPLGASHKDFERYSTPVLVDYLQRSHAYYLKKRLPEIGQSIHAMRRKFVKEDSIYILLSGFFVSYRKELEEHFEYEEKHLFPYAKALSDSKSSWQLMSTVSELPENYSVAEFLNNHTDTEIELKTVREALLQYKAPKDSELPYQILLQQLASFEKDLHLHALIEDKVLVPKLLKLESEITQN